MLAFGRRLCSTAPMPVHLAAALVLALLVRQDEDEVVPDPGLSDVVQPGEDWSIEVSVIGHHFLVSDLKSAPGRLALSQGAVRLQLGRQLDAKRRLGLGLGFEQSFYDFSGGSGVFDDPFDHVSQTGFGASLVTRECEGLSWTTTAYAAMGYEPGARAQDGVTVGGGATTTIRVHRAVLLTVGGFANTRLEDGPLFFPWLQLDWQPTERLHIGEEGSGVGVGYSWFEDLSAYINLSFVERQFRLDASGVAPRGVARDDEFALNTGLVWDGAEHLRVELFGGVAFRQLALLANDVLIDETGVDPTPYLAFNVGYGL